MNANDNYEILSILGDGMFGNVKLAQDKKTKEKVAIKVLEKKKIKDDEDKYHVKIEIEILKKISHLNVIKTKKILEDSENIYIIMEYCEKGELFDRIVEEIYLANDEAACYFYQLINGLDYIHQKGIVHRDLKLENILLNKNNIVKIIDFGLSNFYDSNKLLSTPCGSPSYASPDILSGEKYDGIMIDIWSTGIILYAMLCGHLPFDDENNENLYQKILDCKFDIPQHLEEDSVDLLKKILVKESKKRITIKEIKNHRFYIKGKKEFFTRHPNIIKIFKNRLKNVNQNNRNKEISIIKNSNNTDINQKLKIEGNTKNYTQLNSSLNNTIKLNENNNITENGYKNNNINNIFQEELMKNLLKRKIKINCDSLLINSINLNINNDINQKSQKYRDSTYNKNPLVKSDYIKDIKSDILRGVDSVNHRKITPIYKYNKIFDINNNNNNMNISNLNENKRIFVNRSIQVNNNFNNNSQNIEIKIQKVPFKNNQNNINKKEIEKKKLFMPIRNIKSFTEKIEYDNPESEILSLTPRHEIKNSNITNKINNNVNHRLKISDSEIINQQRKNILNNGINPKKYYRKIVNTDGNLNLKKYNMKYHDKIKTIKNDNHNYTLSNNLTDSMNKKTSDKVKIKKNSDYSKNVFKSNNSCQINYKNNINIRKRLNSSNELSTFLSNNNIMYTRIFNDDKNKKEINNNNIIYNYNKQNISEKVELKSFRNKNKLNYILIENNDENNIINFNNNVQLKSLNGMKNEMFSSQIINFSKTKESKKFNKINHYINLTGKKYSSNNNKTNDIKLNPKQYNKNNINNNNIKSISRNNNRQNYKQHIKMNVKNHTNLDLKNTNKSLERKKYNPKFKDNNINSYLLYLINNMSKSLNELNINFNNDITSGNY